MALWGVASVIDGGPIHYALGGWAPPLGIEYVLDHIAAFVASVVTSVSLLVVVATRRMAAREMQGRLGSFYSLVLLLLAGLTGIVVTGDLFNLFVFLEIASLAAYALVFLGGRRAMLAAYRYLILGTIGGSLYLLGVAFLYFSTGTLNMADTLAILSTQNASVPVSVGAVFIFIGLGLKMALVPLHFWLPDAYNHAPSAVASLIAPVMTKVAAYAMIRMFLSVFPAGYLTDVIPIGSVLITLGLVGVVFGSVAAMGQRDLRRMLAYSSISQVGLIAVGIGLATPLGFVAALLHIMNHAVMKGVLFLVAMSTRMTTGTTEVAQLAGMGRRMPVTMGAFALAAISMVGIPPAAGFFSKWYLSVAAINEGLWPVVVIVLASSLLTAVYMFKVLEQVFFPPLPAIAGGAHEAPPAQDPEASAEPPADVTLPMVFLAAAIIALGVFNVAIVTRVLEPGL